VHGLAASIIIHEDMIRYLGNLTDPHLHVNLWVKLLTRVHVEFDPEIGQPEIKQPGFDFLEHLAIYLFLHTNIHEHFTEKENAQ
jgi:hypothetical protein